MSDFPLLSLIIFLPFVGALLLLVLRLSQKASYWFSVVWSLVVFVIAVGLLLNFADGSTSGFAFSEKLEWLKPLGMNYQVAVDSISAWLIALTAFVSLVAAFSAREIQGRHNYFRAWLLTLETGILGVFAATNLLNFYVFWEVMLIPAYFLIGRWGITRERVKSAIRFVIYTLVGSLLMLVAMLALAFLTVPAGGQPSLDLLVLKGRIGGLDRSTQEWLFLAFAAAFAVKVPLFPLQAWQPDAYAESPTPVTIVLAGVMSKTGTYGFLRFGIFLFPQASQTFAPLICILALASIIYGALAALGQTDLKRLLAYSSLSHTGFIVLGLFALNNQGVNGAVLQMINHGITTPALFLAATALSNRTGTTELAGMAGLQSRMPRLAALFLILSLASLGLPGLNQFAGEFLILGGAWQASAWYAVIGGVGVVLAAWYSIRMFQLIWHGPRAENEAPALAKALDMRPVEYLVFVPLVALIVLLGLAPALVTSIFDGSVSTLLK
jgi:NADH-quinone oxidoreductase subunit M